MVPFSVDPRGGRVMASDKTQRHVPHRPAGKQPSGSSFPKQPVTTAVPSSLLVIRLPEWAAGSSCLYFHFLPLAGLLLPLSLSAQEACS